MIPNRPIHDLTGLLVLQRQRRQASSDKDSGPRFVDVAAMVGLGLLIVVDLLLAWG